jgi:type I restriction enzyme M protein
MQTNPGLPESRTPLLQTKSNGRKFDVTALQSWLWDAACKIRGPLDAPKFKDYILPLIFLKRLSDVFDDEIDHLAIEFGDAKTALKLAEETHRKGGKLVRFYLPEAARWSVIAKKTTGLGEHLTDAVRAVARENPKLAGVIEVADFNATAAGQRIVDDSRLSDLVQVLSDPNYRLGLEDVEPDILGRAYEYLLRKFAEGQGQSAGEFYTPREVAVLMAQLLNPTPGQTVYDPCCGSGGLLIKCHLRLLEAKGEKKNGRLRLPSHTAPLKLFGQEDNFSTFAMARMNAFIHDMEADISRGDTMRRPAFTNDNGSLRQFDLVIANPMWNQEFPEKVYTTDTYGRFPFGPPPDSNADWGWIQHMYSSLNPKGRMAVVLDTNAVNRGSGSKNKSRERDIRKEFVEKGFIETVVLLPENLFYNTGAPGIIVLIDTTREPGSPIRLINASRLFDKGKPKNFLREEDIERIVEAASSPEDIEELCRVVSIETVRDIDYDLSPARHVPIDPDIPAVPVSEALGLADDGIAHLTTIAGQRDALFKAFTPCLNGNSLPPKWSRRPLASVVAKQVSGDWGEEMPDDNGDYVRCAVIRGTDFPDVARGKLAGVPYRYLKAKSFKNRQPRIGDVLVEISGGGKYQNTGRALFFDESLAAEADPPLMFTNFTKLLRVDAKTVLPKYFFHYWSLLYDLGRTARYEKQPTNIKNFKHNDFLNHEFIVFPEDTAVQAKIVEALDQVHAELAYSEEQSRRLQALRHSAMKELLNGALRVERLQ